MIAAPARSDKAPHRFLNSARNDPSVVRESSMRQPLAFLPGQAAKIATRKSRAGPSAAAATPPAAQAIKTRQANRTLRQARMCFSDSSSL
jgi:hypothetical protein